MRRYAVIDKPIGQTPLQAMEEYRASDASLMRVPLTYAGRLDPMASGKLLVLIGDECKKRELYDGLDKEYVFEILLGFKTDTADVLGMPALGKSADASERELHDVARSMVGDHVLPYPAFSSKTVGGKPLFQYALEGTLDSIEIPTADMRVYSMQFADRMSVPRTRLIERILNKIEHLKVEAGTGMFGADFRKDDICKRWWSLQNRTISVCPILRFRATVSSGTYVRSLAPLIAQKLGAEGLAYSIDRTKIGRYASITKHVGFWTRTY